MGLWLFGSQLAVTKRSTDRAATEPRLRPDWQTVAFEIPDRVRVEDGEKIYAKQCASCHGDKGQGVKNQYAHPLRGALTVAKLAKLIEETMPEEDPEKCVGEDAEAVAQYIHEEFYAGTKPAGRIQLVRFTELQLRKSIADLLASYQGVKFTNQIRKDEGRGLDTSYYHSRYFKKDKFVKKRVDATVDFDFGAGLPDVIPKPKKDAKRKNNLEYDPNEFSIHWSGGLIAEKTGVYEFVVKSNNGFKLFLNDRRTPLIHQWVNAGNDEYRARVHLLGGRVYPIRVDFFRFKDKKSGIQLCWIPPGGMEQVIPESALIPTWCPPVGIIRTQFPPDDSSHGYRRGTTVSQNWDDAVTKAAVEVAQRIVGLSQLHRRVTKWSHAEETKLKNQLYDFVERAFGVQLSDEEKQFYVNQFFVDGVSPIDSVKQVVILTIKSPRFLYPNLPIVESARSRQQKIGRRTALYLWDSLPSREMEQLIRKNQLEDAASLEKLIGRMMEDPRTTDKINGFFDYWLFSVESEGMSKDESRFPDFREQIAVDLRQSIDLFVGQVFWSKRSDYRDLFLSESLFLNSDLAKFYEAESAFEKSEPKEKDFRLVSFDKNQRAGILTHPYLMMNLAYHKNTSPIHRGVFVARNLLGKSLPPPPNDVDPLSEEFKPEMTTRQRVEFQTKEIACMNCHAIINPFGFSLENYDAVGRYRDSEKGKPIDSRARIELPDGKTLEFDGPRKLAEFLANSEDAQKSFIRHLFQHLVKQPVEAFGKDVLHELHVDFVRDNFHMQKLVSRIVIVAATYEVD